MSTPNPVSRTCLDVDRFCLATSCIPYVGIVPAALLGLGVWASKKDAKEDHRVGAQKMPHILNMSIAYNKMGMARELCSIALVVGAIALGILSGPTGAIIAGLHLTLTLTHFYQFRKDVQELKALSPRS